KPAAVRVPRVRAHGATRQYAYLAREWIESKGRSSAAEAQLGRQLAAQHRFTAQQFGWHRDNTIGLTPQVNACARDWVEFFGERRLRYQLDLAAKNGYARLLEKPGERLLEALPELLRGHNPQPSLLHGDLWGGNWFATAGDVPVIFDPAVYYGDREADIAMTRLFGGFGAEFYRAYESVWPLPSGHQVRCDLYNLYHILNHANLFGGGYAQQARTMIDRLLAKAG
ncbi:MAG TPA: fructosamine kinase family protein, partial [Steroidobacteraceae bacterium]